MSNAMTAPPPLRLFRVLVITLLIIVAIMAIFPEHATVVPGGRGIVAAADAVGVAPEAQVLQAAGADASP